MELGIVGAVLFLTQPFRLVLEFPDGYCRVTGMFMMMVLYFEGWTDL